MDERDVGLGLVAEQFAGQMRLAAAVGRGKQHAVFRLAGQRHQFGHVVGLDILVHSDRDRLLADHADWRECLDQVERHLAFLLDRQDVVGRGLRHIEGVAVLLDAGRGLRCDQPARAGPVDDDGLLLPHLRELFGHQAADNVRTVAGGGRGDEADRLVGVILRLRRGAQNQRHRRRAPERHPRPIRTHAFLPLDPVFCPAGVV